MKSVLNNFAESVFRFEKSTPSHISVRIFGIKFNFLRPKIKKERTNIARFHNKYTNPTQIPKAEGGLRLVQLADTKLLEVFDSICSENGISYWMDFGTLLGAIRHQGFIPWDDDLDIGMTRDNYEKTVSLFKTNSEKYSDLELVWENNGKNKCFVKIKHKKSDNLFIDIFPYDFYYKKLDDTEKTELSQKISAAQKFSILEKSKNIENVYKNFRQITANKILENKPVDIDAEPCLYMGIDYPHQWKNKVYDWDMIFPLKRIQFEGKEFLAPNKSDEVLSSIYGDYMQLPKDTYPRHASYLDMNYEERKFLQDFVGAADSEDIELKEAVNV